MIVRRTHLDALAVCLLVVCCLFWGFQQVLVKATLDAAPPVMQAALRFAGATVLLLLWCAWRGVRLVERDGSLWFGLLVGVLFCGEFICIYIGLQTTTATRLTIFLYTAPFWVALLLPVFVRTERLGALQWLGLACAFAAVVFALQDRLQMHAANSLGSGGWSGDLLALLAGALWGLTTVVIRSTNLSRISPEKLLLYQVALSAAVLPFISLQLGENWAMNLGTFAWSSIAIQTVAGAFASYLTWMWLLGRYPATQLSTFVFFTPVFALLFDTWWLGEPVTPGIIAALAGIAAGIVLVNKRPAQRLPAEVVP